MSVHTVQVRTAKEILMGPLVSFTSGVPAVNLTLERN